MHSLEKLCLNNVVQNFEQFHDAFIASKDENLQQIFKFLQRRYSAQLATALYVNEQLKEEYFELLINEHLYVLVGNWFKDISFMKYFHRLSNLTTICVRSCTDETLANFVKFCPELVEIDIRYSAVTDDGIRHLYEIKNGMLPCPKLRNLFIRPSSIKDESAVLLMQNIPSLQKFDYQELPELLYNIIHKKNSCYSNKIHYYNLVELDVSECQFSDSYSDILKMCLSVCNKLESLACIILDKQELNFFTKTHLKELRIQFSSKCQEINIDDFLKIIGFNLTCLKISNCKVSTSALAVCCPVLEEFYAHYVNFKDDGDLQEIFPCLTKCSFSGYKGPCTKAFCSLLASSPKLESLSLRFFKLSPEMKNYTLLWCKNTSAKLIEFVCLSIENQFLTNIYSSCSSLKAIFVNQCFFENGTAEGFLSNFATKLPTKPKIYLKRNTYLISDMDEYHEMLKINYDSLFKFNIKILESDLKEEYKCSNIYDSLFAETAFDRNDFFINDDWEENWEII